jgi:hypothetical protein
VVIGESPIPPTMVLRPVEDMLLELITRPELLTPALDPSSAPLPTLSQCRMAALACWP